MILEDCSNNYQNLFITSPQKKYSPYPCHYDLPQHILRVWELTHDSISSIEVKDISLIDYINVQHAVYVRESTFRQHDGNTKAELLMSMIGY